MADDDDEAGVFIVEDEILEPVDGLDVEVVGRLVEHDDVGLAEQRLREQHLDLQPRVSIAHEVIVELDRDAETLQQLRRIGFRFPAVHVGKLGLQLARAHAVLLGKVGLFVERILLLHHVIQMLVAHDDGVENGIGVILVLVLLQNGHPRAGLDGYLAGRRLELAGQDLQKRRLARAVGADDTVAVARHELQIDLLEQHRPAKLHGKIGNRDHTNPS